MTSWRFSLADKSTEVQKEELERAYQALFELLLSGGDVVDYKTSEEKI